MGNLKETHNVLLGFFFPLGKTLWKSQNVSFNGFFGGKTPPSASSGGHGQGYCSKGNEDACTT